MKFRRLILSKTSFVAGLAIVAWACGGGGSNGDGGGGEAGGGAGGEESGGDGGGSSTMGGKGGSSSAMGGNGSGGSASGGSQAGAGGGGTGGMGGGAPGTGGMVVVSGDAPKWCTSKTLRPMTWSGQYDSESLKMAEQKNDPAKSPSTAPKGEIKNDIGSPYYVPSQYAAAADGKVAFGVVFGNFANPTSGDYKWQTLLDNLINTKEIPPLILVFSGTNINDPGAGATAKNTFSSALSAVKAKYPKVSMDAKWHVIAGQSTSGAVVFDVVWDNPTVVANAITGSGSYVCFMPKAGNSNDGYATMIKGSAAKGVRFSMSVGKCDIYGSIPDRIAAGCSGTEPGGDIDKSQCAATWLDVNKEVHNAMTTKSIDHQLLITSFGHSDQTWALWIGDQLRWVFRPITCGS
ncbi:MAG: hypothetical protein SF187_07260 [Deltaproteobacteria bacterium]|nr:hypothetical protein [Deltaproteobacteria bacterium]